MPSASLLCLKLRRRRSTLHLADTSEDTRALEARRRRERAIFANRLIWGEFGARFFFTEEEVSDALLSSHRPDASPVVVYPPPPVGTPSAPPIELSLYGPNLYPTASLPDLETTIREYRALCETLANDLISLIAASLTPQPELIVDAFTPSDPSRPAYSRMKVARYPPVTDGREGAGVGAHRDGGGLTCELERTPKLPSPR